MADPDVVAVLSAFREAGDLLQEVTGKVGDGWARFEGAVRDLLGRTRLFLAGDGAVVWCAVAAPLTGEIEESVTAIDSLVGRMRPVVDELTGTLTAASVHALRLLP